MSYYFSNVKRTLRAAVLAGWIIDSQAHYIAGRIIQALTSRRAIAFYVNAADTFIWLCKAAYVLGQVARILVAIAITWLDAKVAESQAPMAPMEPEENHQSIITDTVVPFQRPYRKPVEEPIDWSKWTADDLKKASQREPFNIPLRVNKKVLSKPQLIDFYTVALANGFDPNAVWSESAAA